MPSLKHTHKYLKTREGKARDFIRWVCRNGNCTHNLPHTMIHNKETLCWRCGEKMVMVGRALQRTRPTCPNCRGEKIKPGALKAIDKLLETIAVDELLKGGQR